MKHARGLTALASAALLFTVASSPVLASDSHAAKAKQEVQYPNATRAEPKLDLTSEKDQKNLNDGLDAVSAGDKAKAEPLLQGIVDGSKSKYAQALALQHDLQTPLTGKKRLRRLIQRVLAGRQWPATGDDEFFRKAVRRHELFWVRKLP